MTKATMSVKEISCTYEANNPHDMHGEMVAPFANEAFQNLVKSIRDKGLLLPVYINRKKQVISGHYRFVGAKEAGLKEVPVRIAESEKEVDYGAD